MTLQTKLLHRCWHLACLIPINGIDLGTANTLMYLSGQGIVLDQPSVVAQVDAEVAAQCRDARDFYGCVRAFTTPVRRSDDMILPLLTA